MRSAKRDSDWRQVVLSSQETFISAAVTSGARCLKNARTADGDWGPFKGVPTDIHTTSVAVQSLRMCKSHEFLGPAEDGATRLAKIARDDFDRLGVQDLIDILDVLAGSKHMDEGLVSRTAIRLMELRRGVGWGEPQHGVGLSCKALIALSKHDKAPEALVNEWIEYLSGTQRVEDGAWGATPESKSAIVPTCYVLLFLNTLGGNKGAKLRDSAAQFLQNTTPWKGSGDTYTIATALRALSTSENISFDVLQTGIDSLHQSRNEDGGWGSSPGEPSTVEHTALVIMALCIAGENRFVPSRLAFAAIDGMQGEITSLRSERDKLLEDIDQRVKQEMKNIISERDDLRTEVAESKREVSQLENKVRDLRMEYRSPLRHQDLDRLWRSPLSSRSGSRIFRAISSMLATTAVGMTAFFLVDGANLFLTIVGGTTVAFLFLEFLRSRMYRYKPAVRASLLGIRTIAILSISSFNVWAYYFLTKSVIAYCLATFVLVSVFMVLLYRVALLERTHLRHYELRFGPESDFLLRELMYILERFPPSIREDIIYQIARLIPEMDEEPEHLAMYLSDRYGVESSVVKRIVELLARLPTSARMEILDRARYRLE